MSTYHGTPSSRLGAIGRRHDIGVEDAGEVVVARDAGGGHPLVERLQRTEGAELRQPGVAELAEVGQGVAGEGGQELLVRCRPRQLLHANLHGRMALAKGREQLDDHFGLAPHGPEIERALGSVLLRPQPASEPASATEPQPIRRIALRRPVGRLAGAPAPGITRPGRASRQ